MTHQAHDPHDRKMVLVLDGGSHINAAAHRPERATGAPVRCSGLFGFPEAAKAATSAMIRPSDRRGMYASGYSVPIRREL